MEGPFERLRLEQLDKDGDGKISQLEFNALYQNAELFFAKQRQEAQPADGRKPPDPLPVKSDPLGLRFTQDYFPGTKDPDGLLMAATEANHLAVHRGMLFASFGATYRKPPTPDPDFVGPSMTRPSPAASSGGSTARSPAGNRSIAGKTTTFKCGMTNSG